MKHFSSYYYNAYGYQTFQGGDMLQGALTHECAWHLNGVVLLGCVTNKADIFTHIDTATNKVLTFC